MNGNSYQCNYCHSTQPAVSCEDIRDWEYGVLGSYDYYRCLECQGLQIHPFPDLEDLRLAYDIDYHGYAAGGRRGLLFSLLYAVKEGFFRKQMRQLVDENSKVLDVGCGAGDFLLSMRELDVSQLQGIDFSADMIERLQEQGIEGFCGTFSEFQGEEGSYHLVSMNNYLEHTLSPGEELSKARNLLAPGAYLVGEVPGYGSWDQKLFGRFWGGNHVPRHTYQFTPQLLEKVLEDAGFTDVKLSHQLNTSHWALSVQNFLQRNVANLRKNPKILHGRSRYYVPLLLLFIPINLVCVLAKRSGCIKFTARKPAGSSHHG